MQPLNIFSMAWADRLKTLSLPFTFHRGAVSNPPASSERIGASGQIDSKFLPDVGDGWGGGKFTLGILICILLGVGIRLALIIASDWRIDYDESMIGLLGLGVTRGELPVFIPAQPTLGTLEAYALAPLFTLFGVSRVAFRIYSLFTAVAYIVTTALLGRAAFDWRIGLITGLLCALAPPYMLMTSLKTWGATIEIIILGNLLLLLIAQALKQGDSPRHYVVGAGFIAGVMFWNAWLGVYYFIAVGLILLWRGRSLLRTHWWVGLLGFIIGSLPFWIYNIGHDFATFETFASASRPALSLLDDTFQHFINTLTPQLLTGDTHWGHYPQIFVVALTIIYGLGLLSLWWHLRERTTAHQQALRWMLTLLTVIIPSVYLFSNYSANALNPWGIDATGRYVVMLHSVLPIGVAVLVISVYDALKPKRVGVVVTGGLIGLVVLINVFHSLRVAPKRMFDSPYYDRLPDDLTPLIDFLDSRAITHVWTDIGIAHGLMFETETRILAADYYDTYIAGGLLRFPAVLDAVENAERTVFIIPTLPNQTDMPILRVLDAQAISYTLVSITPTLVAILPDAPLDPAIIAEGLGYQY